MVALNTVVERLADARQMDFGLSVVPQSLAGHFLNSSYFAPHLDRLRASLLYKRDLLIEALQKELQGLVHFHVPEGGLHLWCKIVPEVNDSKLLETSIHNGVIFAPGSVYGSASGYVRFTYGRARAEDIPFGISKFAQALRSVIQ